MVQLGQGVGLPKRTPRREELPSFAKHTHRYYSRMHILVVCKSLDRPESFILRGLHERGERVTVLAHRENQHSEMLESSGVPVHPFPLRHRLDIRGMVRLRRFVISQEVNVVYALSNAGLSAANFGLLGLPVPITAYRGTIGQLNRFDPSSWLTFFHPRVRLILCVAQAVEHDLNRRGIPKEKTATVYKGHDLSWYHASPNVSRSGFGIPEDAFVVGCTATCRPGKGIETLLASCASLLSVYPQLHVVLIGSIRGDEVRRAVREFPDPVRLHLLGHRPEAAHLATLSDVTVLVSDRREGLPKSVLEAMAQGIPAIVSRVGGMPELVKNGEAGLVVPPMDSPALAHAIQRLANDRKYAQRLGLAGQARVAQEFHVDHTIDRMLSLFRGVVCEKLRGTASSALLAQRLNSDT